MYAIRSYYVGITVGGGFEWVAGIGSLIIGLFIYIMYVSYNFV